MIERNPYKRLAQEYSGTITETAGHSVTPETYQTITTRDAWAVYKQAADLTGYEVVVIAEPGDEVTYEVGGHIDEQNRHIAAYSVTSKGISTLKRGAFTPTS